jgi:hypothetical protein
MTYVQAVQTQILMQGVHDAGSPNFERITFWVSGPMSLAGLGITLAVKRNDVAQPIFDSCFWFPGMEVEQACWVVVYTRKGTAEWSKFEGTPVLNLFWQRNQTTFTKAAPAIVPVLFRIDVAVTGDIQ